MKKFILVLILCQILSSGFGLNCPNYFGLKEEMIANIVECSDNKCFYLEFLDKLNKTKVDRGCISRELSSDYCGIQLHNQGYFGRNVTICKICETSNCNAGSSATVMLSSFVLITTATIFQKFQ